MQLTESPSQWACLKADLRRWPWKTRRDWLYNLFEQALWATTYYRLARALVLVRIPILGAFCHLAAFFLFKLNEMLGVAISPSASIGPGLYIGHTGCLRIHPAVVAGANLSLGPMTLIGAKGIGHPGVPHIGDNVFIGVGSTIIGGITIGDGARIGAGAVVTGDIPAGATAGGVPARVLRMREAAKPYSNQSSSNPDAPAS